MFMPESQLPDIQTRNADIWVKDRSVVLQPMSVFDTKDRTRPKPITLHAWETLP
jgi:hypothetical protein